jgi:hypothetical protein
MAAPGDLLQSAAGRLEAPYPLECVERVSLLKNLLGAHFYPKSGAKYAGFGVYRARFVVAIGSMTTFSTGWGLLRSSP